LPSWKISAYVGQRVANAVQARAGYGVRIRNRFGCSRHKRQAAARCKEYGIRAAFCRGNVRVVGPEGKGRVASGSGRVRPAALKAAAWFSSSFLFETGCAQKKSPEATSGLWRQDWRAATV
jgi:hypothetical protein